jgi:SNF2 family DNA or RNA helicase
VPERCSTVSLVLYGAAPNHPGTTTDYSNIFSLITRMRQMACHPDLVIRSRNNAGVFGNEEGEATVCRLCNDVAEDAIQAKCRHIFDRECIKQYLNASIEAHVILIFYISLRHHANCYLA